MENIISFSYKEKEAYEKGYRIDKDGKASYKGNIIKGYPKKKYKQICFKNSLKKNAHVSFHRLQAYQKYGDKIYQPGIVVRHLDGNTLNNSWDNIAIGSQSDNMFDVNPEERVNHAIKAVKTLIRWDYKKIRAMHESGMSYRQIMKETGITSTGTLSYIINERYLNRDDMT